MKKYLSSVFVAVFLFSHCLLGQTVTGPETFFGFRPGSDTKIAGWRQIVDYFKMLDEASPKIKVREIGRSTNDHPFILAVISSAANMNNLETLRSISKNIAMGRASKTSVAIGKTVVLITCSIHATEIGAAQMSPELAYDLITNRDPRAERILDEVVFLLIPSFNPDGLIMVKEWYDRYLNTPYEGSRMPWLYHPYVGHDNNRDAFMMTQVESRLVNKILYENWFPQIYLDMHQMGSRGARIFLPPFADPVNPNIDPLIVKENSLLGEYMTTDLQAKEFKGVLTRSPFTHWWQGGFLRTAWFHNTVGILSELASARLASPIFQGKSDLQFNTATGNENGATVSFPDPWPGGWWRLRDILNYDLEAAFSLLHFSALHREEFLVNKNRMAQRAVEKGKNEPPYAYVLPAQQWDETAMFNLLQTFRKLGLEIHRAASDFMADGRNYERGSFVILLAQPFRACVKDLLSPQHYPDIREYKDGPPVPPYDNAGWTLSYQMGVDAVEIVHPFEAALVETDQIKLPEVRPVSPGKYGLLLDCRQTDSFKAVNKGFKAGVKISRLKKAIVINKQPFPPGCFVLKGNEKILNQIARELHLFLLPLQQKPGLSRPLKKVRLGVYQPWTASMHEGWSRWVLENFYFDYSTLHNAEIRAGDLQNRYDAIYLPDIDVKTIYSGRTGENTPPEYAGGIGAQGAANLKRFVSSGGILITMGASSGLPLSDFALPVVDITKDLKTTDFFCPGSILRIQVNPDHPLGYGMKAETMAFFSRSPVFNIIPSFRMKPEVVVKYPESDLLKSGYLIGEEKIANGAAVVEMTLGKGRIILIGFDAVNRAQAYNTFKIFFNAVLSAG